MGARNVVSTVLALSGAVLTVNTGLELRRYERVSEKFGIKLSSDEFWEAYGGYVIGMVAGIILVGVAVAISRNR